MCSRRLPYALIVASIALLMPDTDALASLVQADSIVRRASALQLSLQPMQERCAFFRAAILPSDAARDCRISETGSSYSRRWR
jgi:hypothetical protein